MAASPRSSPQLLPHGSVPIRPLTRAAARTVPRISQHHARTRSFLLQVEARSPMLRGTKRAHKRGWEQRKDGRGERI